MVATIQDAVYLGLIAASAIVFTDALKKIWLDNIISQNPALLLLISGAIMVFARKISEKFPG